MRHGGGLAGVEQPDNGIGRLSHAIVVIAQDRVEETGKCIAPK